LGFHPAQPERSKPHWYARSDAIFRSPQKNGPRNGAKIFPQKRCFEAAQGAQWRPKRLWAERQLATGGITGWKKVTKGNKVLASGALSGALEGIGPIARRASIYQPERVIGADFEVVRDTGFEPVTSCV